MPFANSKLTSLLAPALGGNCKTAVIVTAAIEAEHAAETVQSLRFGELCSSVQTETHNHLKVDTAELDSQIKRVEADIKRKEHWDVQSVATAARSELPGGLYGLRPREIRKTNLSKIKQFCTIQAKLSTATPCGFSLSQFSSALEWLIDRALTIWFTEKRGCRLDRR